MTPVNNHPLPDSRSSILNSGRQLRSVFHNRWKNNDNQPITQQMLWWTMGHPFYLAEMLMKMGYEPIHPSPEVYFGHTFLALPNSFRYVCHIVSVDGLRGCFKGLVPQLAMNSLESFVRSRVESKFPMQLQTMDEKEVKRYFKDLSFKLTGKRGTTEFADFVKMTIWKVLSVTLSTIATQPLYVIMCRSIAAFVGKERHCTSVVSCIKSIWEEGGISGFFIGLIPRLLFQNLKVIIPASVFFFASRCFLQWNGFLTVSTVMTKMWTNVYLHQFDVVAATMAVQNTSLAISQFSYMTKNFKGCDWIGCWMHLRNFKIHNRGMFPVFRYYHGPTALDSNGELKPAGVNFGPLPYSTNNLCQMCGKTLKRDF